MPSRRATTLRMLLRLLGPALLVVVVLRLERREALVDLVRSAKPWPLLFAVLGALLPLHLKVLRWRALLATRGHHYSLGKAYVAMLASLYLGMLTPGRVGDVLRIQYLRHDLGVRYAEGLAVTVMDRICDLYVLAAFVALGAAHFASYLSRDLAIVTAGAVAVAVLAPLLLLLPGIAERLLGRLYRLTARGGGSEGFNTFLGSLRAQVDRRLGYAVLLTAAAFLCNYGQGWLIGQALGLPLLFVDVAALLAITSLLGLMPISVSGLGVRELFLALVFPALGMGQEQGVAFGLMVFATMYLVYVAVGFAAWQLRPPPFSVGEPSGGDS